MARIDRHAPTPPMIADQIMGEWRRLFPADPVQGGSHLADLVGTYLPERLATGEAVIYLALLRALPTPPPPGDPRLLEAERRYIEQGPRGSF